MALRNGVDPDASARRTRDRQHCFALREQLRADLNNTYAQTRAARGFQVSRPRIETLEAAPWYHPEWVNDTLRNAAENFDKACNRWRELYRGAQEQFRAANNVIEDATKTVYEKQQAKRQRSEAENQLALLTDSGNAMQSDFYTYRYFASEGFCLATLP